MTAVPRLVAHRGYPAAYPENTLLGYRRAVALGAEFVETDIQCTRDGVPVLYHDVSTKRMSGIAGSITDMTFDQLGALDACFPGRFGDRFTGIPIPALKAFSGWLAGHPGVTAFVEIKAESLACFGTDTVVEWVAGALSGVEEQCVIISFDDRCVERAASTGMRTGWVLPRWDTATGIRARDMKPEYLFVDRALVPTEPGRVWAGPWQWAVYVVNDPGQVSGYAALGMSLVETDAIGDMATAAAPS